MMSANVSRCHQADWQYIQSSICMRFKSINFVNILAHTDAIVNRRHIDAIAMRSAGIAVVSNSGLNAARTLIAGITK
jgi:hypothetical protein